MLNEMKQTWYDQYQSQTMLSTTEQKGQSQQVLNQPTQPASPELPTSRELPGLPSQQPVFEPVFESASKSVSELVPESSSKPASQKKQLQLPAPKQLSLITAEFIIPTLFHSFYSHQVAIFILPHFFYGCRSFNPQSSRHYYCGNYQHPLSYDYTKAYNNDEELGIQDHPTWLTAVMNAAFSTFILLFYLGLFHSILAELALSSHLSSHLQIFSCFFIILSFILHFLASFIKSNGFFKQKEMLWILD